MKMYFYIRVKIIYFQSPEDTFRHFGEKFVSKLSTLQMLTNGRLDRLLQSKVEESFFSYEAKKKLGETTST